jgi:hypothetical protein
LGAGWKDLRKYGKGCGAGVRAAAFLEKPEIFAIA